MTTFTSIIPVGGDTWLDDAACRDLDINDFFVQAGHIISEDVLNVCRACPVRRDCVRHSYDESLNVTGGYFGGLSPGQRREMGLVEALDYIALDTVDRPRSAAPGDDVVAYLDEDAFDEDPIEYS